MATKKKQYSNVPSSKKDRKTRKFHGQLGDVELRSDVDEYIRDDPVARLGWMVVTRGLAGKGAAKRIQAIIAYHQKQKRTGGTMTLPIDADIQGGKALFPYANKQFKRLWDNASPEMKVKIKKHLSTTVATKEWTDMRKALRQQGIEEKDLPLRVGTKSEPDTGFPMSLSYTVGTDPNLTRSYGKGMTSLAHELHHIGDIFLKGHNKPIKLIKDNLGKHVTYSQAYPYGPKGPGAEGPPGREYPEPIAPRYEWRPSERRAYFRDYERKLRNLGDPFAPDARNVRKTELAAVAFSDMDLDSESKRFKTNRLAELAMEEVFNAPPKIDPYEQQRTDRYLKNREKVELEMGGSFGEEYAQELHRPTGLSSLIFDQRPSPPFSVRSRPIIKKIAKEQTGEALAPIPGHPPTKHFLYKDVPPKYNEEGELHIGEYNNFSSGGAVQKKKKSRTQKRYAKKLYASGGRVAKYKK